MTWHGILRCWEQTHNWTMYVCIWKQCLGRFWGIVGQDRCDSQSSRLHVDMIFRFCFHLFGVYSSIDFSKMMGNSPEVSTFNRLFLNLNRFIYCIVTNRRFSPSSNWKSLGFGYVSNQLTHVECSSCQERRFTFW